MTLDFCICIFMNSEEFELPKEHRRNVCLCLAVMHFKALIKALNHIWSVAKQNVVSAAEVSMLSRTVLLYKFLTSDTVSAD